jgi:hypothetical protein
VQVRPLRGCLTMVVTRGHATWLLAAAPPKNLLCKCTTEYGTVGIDHLPRRGNVTLRFLEGVMNASNGFTPIGELTADDRSRIAFGKAGVRRDDRYAVAINDQGEILLTPLVSIPKRELIVWENEQLRASLARGLADSAAGRVKDLGDFTQYANDDETQNEADD